MAWLSGRHPAVREAAENSKSSVSNGPPHFRLPSQSLENRNSAPVLGADGDNGHCNELVVFDTSRCALNRHSDCRKIVRLQPQVEG